MNLSQVNLFVEDSTTMLRFYRDALGFQTNEMDPGPPSIPMVNWASLRTGNTRVELFDAQTFWDQNLLRRANRDTAQLCFIVDSVPRNEHVSRLRVWTVTPSSARNGVRTRPFGIRRAIGWISSRCSTELPNRTSLQAVAYEI